MFFAYPAGPPGIALMLLRASIVLWLASVPIVSSTSNRIVIMSCLIAFALSVGFGARFVAGFLALGVLLIWLAGQVSLATCAAPCLDSLALTLIGPGAYSIDAIIFGRRTIRLPH